MKMLRRNKIMIPGLLGSSLWALIGCSGGGSIGVNSATQASTAPAGTTAAAGNGATKSLSVSVPTGPAIIARIQNGLQGNVSASSGNFAKSLALVQGNLPKTTDPTKATGYDQVQLLVYAACSDLTTGSTPLMMSKYNVNPKTSISANQTNLVAAGTQMLDSYLAGLASQGPSSAAVNTTLVQLVQEISSVTSNTTTIAFMSVCIAANTAGSTLMGF